MIHERLGRPEGSVDPERQRHVILAQGDVQPGADAGCAAQVLAGSPKQSNVTQIVRIDPPTGEEVVIPVTSSDSDALSEAVVAYLGFGRERSPRTDAAAAGAASARSGGAPTVSGVEQVVAESLAIPVDWSRTGLGDAGRQVSAEMRRRHPGLSDLAADALGWNFTFQWR